MSSRSLPRLRRVPHVGWVVLVLLTLLFDQGTKVYAQEHFLISPPSTPIPLQRAKSLLILSMGCSPQRAVQTKQTVQVPWFDVELTHVGNGGVIFGLLETAPRALNAIAFYGTTAIALVAAVWLLRREDWWPRAMGAAWLAAGVLGNLVDRIRLGYVIDWVVLQWRVSTWEVHLPAFNLGDLTISAAAAVLALAFLPRATTASIRRRARTAPKAQSTSGSH